MQFYRDALSFHCDPPPTASQFAMMIAACITLLLTYICVSLLVNIKSVRQFWRVYKFSTTLKGPSIRELYSNSKQKGLLLPFVLRCARTYGSRFSIWMSTSLIVVVTDPEDAKIVLQSQELLHKAPMYSLLRNWLGDGLLVAGGQKWQRARKFLTPAFHFNVLKQFKEAMTDCNGILIERLQSQCTGEPVNIYPYITLFALDVICETALGVKKNAQVNSTSDYVSAVEGMCTIIHTRAFSVWLQNPILYRMSKLFREEKKLLKVLHGETNSLIRERRELIMGWDLKKLKAETSGNNYEGSKRRLAFLDMLLIAQLEGYDITDQQIREEVDTFVFEGHDTTGSALSFALYMLSLHGNCQERAYEEAVEFEGREQENMRYLEAVIKETLRLYPAVPGYYRHVMKDFQLDDLTIPAGTIINILAFALQRNPKVYKEPDTFHPERYLDEDNLHPFANVAFSAGPRNCIGQKFAMLEMKCTLAALLRAYKFKEASTSSKPILLAEITLKSLNGIHVVLERRRGR